MENDINEVFRAIKEENRRIKERNLEEARPILKFFKKYTEYHYALKLKNKRLDYWPSTNKWRYDDKTYHGNSKKMYQFLLDNTLGQKDI